MAPEQRVDPVEPRLADRQLFQQRPAADPADQIADAVAQHGRQQRKRDERYDAQTAVHGIDRRGDQERLTGCRDEHALDADRDEHRRIAIALEQGAHPRDRRLEVRDRHLLGLVQPRLPLLATGLGSDVGLPRQQDEQNHRSDP